MHWNISKNGGMCKRGQQSVPEAFSHHQLSPQNIHPHPWASGHHTGYPTLVTQACLQKCVHVLTRVPFSALRMYEELKNLRLVLGSSGISSLFLNHWYCDLGKPSSSTQLSSAGFPKGTDFGTLHFGTTGFTAATESR